MFGIKVAAMELDPISLRPNPGVYQSIHARPPWRRRFKVGDLVTGYRDCPCFYFDTLTAARKAYSFHTDCVYLYCELFQCWRPCWGLEVPWDYHHFEAFWAGIPLPPGVSLSDGTIFALTARVLSVIPLI